MRMISAIVFGFVLGTIAAIASLAWGHGILTALGAYVLFGMVGTILGAMINWISPRPFTRAKRSNTRNAQMGLSTSAAGQTRS